jgi:hypothetical protein
MNKDLFGNETEEKPTDVQRPFERLVSPPPYFSSAVNTINASWWTVTKAKLFGKKLVGKDGIYTVTMYAWRGKYYVTDCRQSG